MERNVSVRNMSSSELQDEFDKRWYKFKNMPTHVNYSHYAEVKSELERRGMTVCLTGYSSKEIDNNQNQPGM